MSIAPLVAALALFSPSPLLGQGPGTLVEVDFRALTADGTPVTDLKASEITLKVGGKAREVRSVDPVAASGAPAGPAPANPPYATNAGGATRTVLLVIDDESVMPGREQTLTSALTAIAAGVPAGDRVGLLSVRRGGVNIPPSTDRTTVRAAVDSLRGQSSTETDEAFKCRTQITLQALESILASAPADSPTTVIFMSASLSQPGEAMARMRPPSDIESRSDLCRLTTENFEKVGTAAAGSRAHFYVVQLVDGTTRSPSEAGPGIENVAGVAGVDTRRVTASGDTTVARILTEMAATYTAAFEADPSDRSAAALPIELKVTRAGANTIAPSRIRVANASGRARAKPSARDMIRVAETFTDLPIRAAGFASRGADNKLKVIALFESIDPAVKLSSAVIGLFATDGTLKAQWTAQAADFARSPATAALTVAPGTYRMRVAAVDSNGRAGTADYTLDANLSQTGPVQLSTLVIGAPVAGSFGPQLHFTAKDAAGAGYLEIYGVPLGSTVTVTLEVAPSEDAPAIGNVPAQVVPGDTPDMRRAVGGFSIENLAPGDHVMRAIVSVDGKVVGRAVRTFRKSANP